MRARAPQVSFFVGWAWVVVLRDLEDASWLRGQSLQQSIWAGIFRSSQNEAQRVAWFGALFGVILFGPVLTVVVLALKAFVFEQYAASQGEDVHVWGSSTVVVPTADGRPVQSDSQSKAPTMAC